MERDDAMPSLHRRIGEAMTRAALIQEESRDAVAATRAVAAALERTVADAHRYRARRTFGNGQADAEDPEGAG